MKMIMDLTLRLFIAAFLGGIIGLEREKHGRPAGLRTHILVALGSALTMIVSLHLYDIFKIYNTSNYASGVDPSRVASLVMTGIGFIGAGTIIQSRGSIWGLTTAACLWVSAALGLAVGCGHYIPAVIATLISMATLLLLKIPVESRLQKDWYQHIDIEMEDRKDGLEDLKGIFKGYDANILKVNFVKQIPDNDITYNFSLRLRNNLDYNLIEGLARVQGVKKVITT
jgi:putative Mg2+ transporter-C (MgtC) family protein